MIRFSCVYCGRRLQAPDRLVRQQARCPACRHWLRVRPVAKPNGPDSHEAIPAEEPTADGVVAGGPFWEAMTNEEILEYARSRTQPPPDPRKREAQRYVSLSCARYDDLTLFTLSLALLLLLVLNLLMARDLVFLAAVFSLGEFALPIVLGMILSLVNIAIPREKSEPEKMLMLLFAMLATGGVGVYAGWIVLKDSPRWLMIFPAWNILSSAILVFEWCAGLVTTDSITDERPTAGLIIATTASTILLVLLCQYAFKLHWAIAFSVTVCYTMSLQSVIQEFFPSRQDATPENV